MKLDDAPRSIGEAQEEEMEDELLIYHPSEGKVFNLNGTAAFIWSVCDGDRTLDEMVEIIHEEAPDQSRSVIENDVLDFAEDLLEEGLIENSGD